MKLAVIDSESLKARIEAQTLDIAMVFEDELVPVFSRAPLFRQRLYLIRREPLGNDAISISFDRLAALPLILPSPPNVVRSLLDRAFAAAGVSPNVVAEADVLSGILSALSTGMGSTVLPKGDFSDISADLIALLIEPPLFLTASIISSGDFPLTYAGEAVRNILMKCAERHFGANDAPGVDCGSFQRWGHGGWTVTSPTTMNIDNGMQMSFAPGQSFGPGTTVSGVAIPVILDRHCGNL